MLWSVLNLLETGMFLYYHHMLFVRFCVVILLYDICDRFIVVYAPSDGQKIAKSLVLGFQKKPKK